jgi:hypothetical protein
MEKIGPTLEVQAAWDYPNGRASGLLNPHRRDAAQKNKLRVMGLLSGHKTKPRRDRGETAVRPRRGVAVVGRGAAQHGLQTPKPRPDFVACGTPELRPCGTAARAAGPYHANAGASLLGGLGWARAPFRASPRSFPASCMIKLIEI